MENSDTSLDTAWCTAVFMPLLNFWKAKEEHCSSGIMKISQVANKRWQRWLNLEEEVQYYCMKSYQNNSGRQLFSSILLTTSTAQNNIWNCLFQITPFDMCYFTKFQPQLRKFFLFGRNLENTCLHHNWICANQRIGDWVDIHSW